MSAIDVLRSLRKKKNKRAEEKQTLVEWGAFEYIKKMGVENMSRKQLKNHLEARDASTEGNLMELKERLKNSIQEEELATLAYTDTADTEFLIQADLEERGSCYAIGTNFSGQLGLGDLGLTLSLLSSLLCFLFNVLSYRT